MSDVGSGSGGTTMEGSVVFDATGRTLMFAIAQPKRGRRTRPDSQPRPRHYFGQSLGLVVDLLVQAKVGVTPEEALRLVLGISAQEFSAPGPLPFTWVTADAAYGQGCCFRRFLEDIGLSYVVAVPKSQQVRGPRIDYLIGQVAAEAWQRLTCGDGATGSRLYDWAAAGLPAVWEFEGDEPTRQRWMLARRSFAKPDEIAYFLASAGLCRVWLSLRDVPDQAVRS
ncbi:hypothetical protein ACFWBR_25020 [Streptomyces sp. NPDC060006]|uniref:hypothetical protein n=1 Tax=unclassified Streptomyces TaxID=2593676 RepID=UPI0036CC81B2